MKSAIGKLRYLLTEREQGHTVGMLVLLACGAALEIVSVSAIPAFVALLAQPRKLLEYVPTSWHAVVSPTASDSALILYAAAGLLTISVVKNLCLALIAHLQNGYVFDRQAAIAQRLLRAYLHAPYTFHLQHNTAGLLRNANEGALGVISAAVLPVFTLVLEGLTIVAITGLLLVREPLISLVALALLGGATLGFIRAVRGRMAAYGAEMYGRRTDMIRTVNEGLGGIKITRVLGRERHFAEAFADHAARYAHAARFRQTAADLPRLYLETTAVLGLLAVAALLLLQHRPMQVFVPVLSLFGVAVVRMVPSVNRVTGAITTLRYGRHDLDAVYGDLAQLDAAAVRPAARPVATGLPLTRGIEFQGVTFRYPTAPAPALHRISLHIRKGTAIGIVGPTGSGKTTFVDLILGLLQPTEGRILVDGVDIHDDIRAWQDRVGYVPQDTYLTDDTIRRNIALGLADAAIDPAAIDRAVEAAQLADFVASLPDGLDTMVGERGVRLSGGQRQRIGIARALYTDPEVLVMDEATSSLDGQTERFVMQAVESLRENRTVILVAHRMTTVRNCDVLVMLADGGVAHTGTYAELIASSQRFRGMASVDDSPQAPTPAVAGR